MSLYSRKNAGVDADGVASQSACSGIKERI